MITTGNNTNPSTAVLFYERLAYSEVGYPISNTVDPASSTNMDFFNLKPFYGRIDTLSDIVSTARMQGSSINETAFLKSFQVPNQRAMNFIVDAYAELENEFNGGCLRINDLNKTGPLSSLRVRKSWRSPITAYKEYFSTLFKDSVDSRIDNLNYNDAKTIKDFLKIFFAHLEYKVNLFPITFGSYTISRYGNVLTSGLALEIDTGDYGDDLDKTTRFVLNTNFKYYLEQTQKYGFYVDRDVPWRIVANLKSQKMIERMKRYNITNLQEMFDKQFVKAYSIDIILLREVLHASYNLFAEQFKQTSKTDFSGCRIVTETTSRSPITLQEFNKNVPDTLMLKIYCYFKCAELRSGITQTELNKIINDVLNFHRAYGLSQALRHANYYFNGLQALTLEKNFLTTKSETDIMSSDQFRKLVPKISILL